MVTETRCVRVKKSTTWWFHARSIPGAEKRLHMDYVSWRPINPSRKVRISWDEPSPVGSWDVMVKWSQREPPPRGYQHAQEILEWESSATTRVFNGVTSYSVEVDVGPDAGKPLYFLVSLILPGTETWDPYDERLKTSPPPPSVSICWEEEVSPTQQEVPPPQGSVIQSIEIPSSPPPSPPPTPSAATLIVQSDVPASIYVDEREVGTAPVSVSVQPGYHVIVGRYGGRTKRTSRALRSGETEIVWLFFGGGRPSSSGPLPTLRPPSQGASWLLPAAGVALIAGYLLWRRGRG